MMRRWPELLPNLAHHVQQAVGHPRTAYTSGSDVSPVHVCCVMLWGGARLCAMLQVDQTCLLEVLQEEPTFDHQHFQDVKAVEGGSRVEPKPEGEPSPMHEAVSVCPKVHGMGLSQKVSFPPK